MSPKQRKLILHCCAAAGVGDVMLWLSSPAPGIGLGYIIFGAISFGGLLAGYSDYRRRNGYVARPADAKESKTLVESIRNMGLLDNIGKKKPSDD